MARGPLAAPFPAPRGKHAAPAGRLGQPAGAAGRDGGRAAGPVPPLADGHARPARRHRDPARRTARAGALSDWPADLPRPARHLLGPAADHRLRGRRHQRPAGLGGRLGGDVRQAEGQHRRPAQGHVDGVRRLAVRPLGFPGTGLPRVAGKPGAGPLPYRARGMARPRHQPSRLAGRDQRQRSGLCRGAARAQRRGPRRTDPHAATHRGGPPVGERRQRHPGGTAGLACRDDAHAAEPAGPLHRTVDRDARGRQPSGRSLRRRGRPRGDGGPPAQPRGPAQPPGRGGSAQPRLPGRRTARRVRPAVRPHRRRDRSRGRARQAAHEDRGPGRRGNDLAAVPRSRPRYGRPSTRPPTARRRMPNTKPRPAASARSRPRSRAWPRKAHAIMPT